jgi:hypothetical protein
MAKSFEYCERRGDCHVTGRRRTFQQLSRHRSIIQHSNQRANPHILICALLNPIEPTQTCVAYRSSSSRLRLSRLLPLRSLGLPVGLLVTLPHVLAVRLLPALAVLAEQLLCGRGDGTGREEA